MALNIKNEEVEELTRDLARDMACSQVEVVLRALREMRDERLAAERRRVETRRRALLLWVDELKKSSLKPLMTREQLDAEMYDEDGLPK